MALLKKLTDLKVLTTIAAILYLVVYYGQIVFPKWYVIHSELCTCINDCLHYDGIIRKYYYFIGMSVFKSLVSFILYKTSKNIVTSYLVFMLVGEFFNNVFCRGEFTYLEIGFGIVGFIYVLFEDKIKIVFKRWKR
jgi:hypothetical protein